MVSKEWEAAMMNWEKVIRMLRAISADARRSAVEWDKQSGSPEQTRYHMLVADITSAFASALEHGLR